MTNSDSDQNEMKTPKPKHKSGVSFPYTNLESAVNVAETVHSKAGGACTREQLSSYLGYSGIKNGGFLSRVSAAKMFGLIEQESDTIRVTERGMKIISPVLDGEREQALVDAFLAVELFQRVYEQYKGANLPAEEGLKNLFLNHFKIVPDRVSPTIKLLFDSAETAGYFKIPGNRSKLITPPISKANSTSENSKAINLNNLSAKTEGQTEVIKQDAPKTDVPIHHPFIEGLLKTLPPPETEWSVAGRIKWLQAASNIFGLIYTTKDGAENDEYIEINKIVL